MSSWWCFRGSQSSVSESRRPAGAIGCATAVVSAVRELGLEVRVGIHTGECEATGTRLTGLAVHLGARVAALAAPGQILVSRTVKDLVAGSGIELTDRGTHAFKGIPDAWQVFEVISDHAA